MIKNSILTTLDCIDDSSDKIKIIEGINFDTKVLNFKSFNSLSDRDFIVTDVFLNKEKVVDLIECLKKWVCKN